MQLFKPPTERGQAIVLLALGIFGLIGITALAIDGGNAFADRRHAQNAADTAAFAGALAKVGGDTAWKSSALDRAASNGYSDSDPDANTTGSADVQVYSPPINGPYKDNNNFVQVIIRSTVSTYFGSVIGVDFVTNRVNAVAMAQPGGLDSTYMGSSLMSMRATCSTQPGLQYGGKSETYVYGGGIFVNANCTGFQQTGCPGTLYVEDPGLVSVGDSKFPIDEKCKNPVLQGKLTVGVPPLPFPPPFKVDKPVCPAGVIVSNDKASKTTVLAPGAYDAMPPAKVGSTNVEANVILQSGNYCVNGPFKQTTGSLKVETGGTGVMFYVSAYNAFDISGGKVNIFARTNDKTNPYYGLLIYVDPGTYNKNPVPTCTINGNQDMKYAGTIFAPYCNITINGTGDTNDQYAFSSQLIGYEIKLEGNANFTISYNPDLSYQFINPPRLALSE